MNKLRHNFIYIGLAIIFGILFLKLIYMQTFEHKKLKHEGDMRSERSIIIPAYRGKILDRNGKVLAISSLVETAWVNPRYIDTRNPDFLKILNILSLTQTTKNAIIKKLNEYKGRSGFIYLKRQVSPAIAQKIDSLAVLGVHLKPSFKRFYPTSYTTSQVIGFTNIDGKGESGIELKYNKELTGKNGKESFQRDLKGGIAKINNDNIPSKNGKNISLSIDSRLQFIAYKYLKEGVIQNNADAGSVVIENVHTGAILAMTNYPSYNPNEASKSKAINRRNRTVTDVYEPGSVVKPFVAAMALKSGKYNMKSIIDTDPGYYKIGNNTVRDEGNFGKLDLRHILMKSSNVGISKITLSMDDHHLLPKTLRSFGFGTKTDIDFPGERNGIVPYRDKWPDFALATLSFGYGITVTPLQLAQAYSTIANHGVLIPPSLIKIKNNSEIKKHRVMSVANADKILSMLNSVVEEYGGTAWRARLNEYHVAGKTGTARKAIRGGYSANAYITTFAGIAPYPSPQIVIIVKINNPKGQNYGGGSVAAPVFKKIARHALIILGITPNKTT